MTFRKAERTQAKLKIALTGPSGAGKTFSALLIAAGIGKKIAVIDTENKSASLYAGVDKGPLAGIEFDLVEIEPPYSIVKYAEAIEAAVKEGYEVLIVDSISHAWAGEGGLLDKKAAMDARGGNSYTNWNAITPEHERFKSRILQADIHIICTMRSKQDYVLEMNDKGKQAPRKVGLAPIQRDGMEYEFTSVFDLAMDHNAQVSKDRTGLFDGQIFRPSQKTGEILMTWLLAGKPVSNPVPAAQRSAGTTAASKAGAVLEKAPAGAQAVPAAAAPATAKSKKADPAAQPKEASACPGYDFGADSQATKAQLTTLRNGIGIIVACGFTESSTWDVLRNRTQKIFDHRLTEIKDLTIKEADDLILYLAAWNENIKSKRAKVAANAGKET